LPLDPAEESSEVAARRVRADANLHTDARVPQTRQASAGDPPVGIAGCRDDTGDAGRTKGVGAWRRLAMMGTRFKGDVGGRPFRGRAGMRQCHGFGMRPAAGLRPAAADNPQPAMAPGNDHATNGRIFGGGAAVAAAKPQGKIHVELVGRAHSLIEHDRGRSGVLFLGAGKLAQKLLEILGLSEVLVHRCEADISHVIEPAQTFHDKLADHIGGNIAFTDAFQAADDAADHTLDAFGLDGPLSERDLHRAHELVPVERHPPRVFLNNRQFTQLHPFERRKARTARTAITAPANGGVVLRRPGILHLRVAVSAIRTFHSSAVPPLA
jgi:hypothetical protein